jgi:hypothetical protein
VSYQGKLIGGVRVRKPKSQTAPPPLPPMHAPAVAAATVVPEEEIFDDEVPF